MRVLPLLLSAVLLFANVVSADDASNQKSLKKATFAGGCFWCMQPFFDRLKGVEQTVVGYTGGNIANPTYKQVTSGTTGHAEAIEITYDPQLVSYARLLDIYWRNIDPTTKDQQFYDQGSQYRTAVFYHDDEQKKMAEDSKKKLAASGKFKKTIVTEIVPASVFYPAEEYHQKYYKKNYLDYKAYSVGSGREKFLKTMWGNENK